MGPPKRRGPGRPPKAPAPPKDQVRDWLIAQLGIVGGMISLVRPVTGTVMMDRADRAANALIALGNQYPGVRRVLESMMKFAAWEELGEFALSMTLAAGVDAGTVDPDGKFTQALIGESISDEMLIELRRMNVQRQVEAERAAQEAGAPAG